MRSLKIAVLSLLLAALAAGLWCCRVAGKDPEPTQTESFAWERVIAPALPLPSGLYGGEHWALNDVCFVSESEGWAVGSKETVNGDAPLVYHYQNGTWTEVSPPLGGDVYYLGSAYAVAAAPNGDAWCVGTLEYDGVPVALVRTAAGEWVHVDVSTAEVTLLRDVTINADGHAVAVGDGAVVEISYDPVEGTYVVSATYLNTGTGEVYAVDWGNHGYVGGNYAAVGNAADNLAAIWESTNYEDNTIASLSLDSGRVYGLDLHLGVSGWAVGTASGPLLLQHGAGGWTQYDASGFPGSLTGVALSSATEGWAVGYSGGDIRSGVVLRYQDGTWTDVSSELDGLIDGSWWLLKAAAPSSDEAWGVGNASSEGILLHYHQVN